MKKNRVSRLRKNEPVPKRKYGRYILLLILLSTVVYYVPKDNFRVDLGFMNKVDGVPVTHVMIQGDFQFASKADVHAAVAALSAGDFMTLDLDELRETLLAEPWLHSISVSRVWPSSIKVVVEEEHPIARWGEDSFLNRYGEIVQVDDLSSLQHLPVLWGDDSEAYDIARDYLTMSRLLDNHELTISALSVGEEGSWVLELDGKFVVKLGDKNLSLRVERFLYLYQQQLKTTHREFTSIDMRYPSGIAVSWKSINQKNDLALANTKKIASR